MHTEILTEVKNLLDVRGARLLEDPTSRQVAARLATRFSPQVSTERWTSSRGQTGGEKLHPYLRIDVHNQGISAWLRAHNIGQEGKLQEALNLGFNVLGYLHEGYDGSACRYAAHDQGSATLSNPATGTPDTPEVRLRNVKPVLEYTEELRQRLIQARADAPDDANDPFIKHDAVDLLEIPLRIYD